MAIETGLRLAEARDLHGLTQKGLANASGWFSEDDSRKPGVYSSSTIGMYEQGSRGISAEDAMRFAELMPRFHAAFYVGLISKRESAILLAAQETEAPVQHKGASEIAPKKAKKQPSSKEAAA